MPSNVPYKRVKYEKQNGFDIPYFDSSALPFASICATCERYEVINSSRTSTLTIRSERCLDQQSLDTDIPPDTYLYICSCQSPIRIAGSTSYSITSIGVCP